MPRVKSTVKVDRSIQRRLMEDEGIKAQLVEGAMRIEAPAHALARAEAYDTGDYEKSIGIRVTPDSVRVVATDWKSHWIEWGTSTGFAARAILRRSAQMAGFRVHGGRK